jgi:hypothetical protein
MFQSPLPRCAPTLRYSCIVSAAIKEGVKTERKSPIRRTPPVSGRRCPSSPPSAVRGPGGAPCRGSSRSLLSSPNLSSSTPPWPGHAKRRSISRCRPVASRSVCHWRAPTMASTDWSSCVSTIICQMTWSFRRPVRRPALSEHRQPCEPRALRRKTSAMRYSAPGPAVSELVVGPVAAQSLPCCSRGQE